MLIDPISKQVRYVGKTVRPKKRLFDHVQDAKNDKRGRRDHRSCWLRSLLAEGIVPRFVALEWCPLESWQDRERYWISILRLLGCDLVNSNSGGVGPTWVSEATRLKLAKALALRNQNRKGWKWTESQIQRLSATRRKQYSALTMDQRRAMTAPMVQKRKPGWNRVSAERRTIHDEYSHLSRGLRYYYRNKKRNAEMRELM